MRRPSEFVSSVGQRVYLYEYKRVASPPQGRPTASPRHAVSSNIVGKWRITAVTFGGSAHSSLIGSIHTILKDRMIRPNLRTQYGYWVDGKGEINLTAPRLGDEHLRGIYSLKGNTLKICYAYEPDMRRPSEFVSPRGQRVYLYEYERVADATKSTPVTSLLQRLMPQRWARLSPFTRVRCLDGDSVEVMFDNKTYELVSIDGLPTPKILQSARTQFGGLWEKRFVEDIVEVLGGMGHAPGDAVELVLRDPKSGALRKVERAPLTAENRRKVYEFHYNQGRGSMQVTESQEVATSSASSEQEKLAALRKLRFAKSNDGDARTHEVIVAMIALANTTKHSSVRADVFRQLDGVTDPILEEVLLDALANDQDASVRSEAAETLAHYRSSARVAKALSIAMKGDASSDVRNQARRSLGRR